MFEHRYPESGEVFKDRGEYYRIIELKDKRSGTVESLSEGKIIKDYEWGFGVDILKDEVLIKMAKYPIGSAVTDYDTWDHFIIESIGSYKNDHELRLIKCTWTDWELVTTTVEEFLERDLRKDNKAIEMFDQARERKRQEREAKELEDFKQKLREDTARDERRLRTRAENELRRRKIFLWED